MGGGIDSLKDPDVSVSIRFELSWITDPLVPLGVVSVAFGCSGVREAELLARVVDPGTFGRTVVLAVATGLSCAPQQHSKNALHMKLVPQTVE